MSDDWDIDDEPVNSGSSTPAPAALPPKVAARGKWQGEDEEEEQDDWDASEDEKPKPATTNGNAAAPKKKMTLKQKLAEKEKLAEEAKLRGDTGDDDLMDTMTEQERRRLAREREQEADLAVAADLMGDNSLDDNPAQLLQSIIKARPSSKNDFTLLSKNIFSALIKKHEENPLYSTLVEQLAKDMCEALTAVQTRKVSSSLSVLGNTKQQEERDKASGKKKTTAKPKLGAAKPASKIDTEAYDDVLDDDDFM